MLWVRGMNSPCYDAPGTPLFDIWERPGDFAAKLLQTDASGTSVRELTDPLLGPDRTPVSHCEANCRRAQRALVPMVPIPPMRLNPKP